MTARAIGLGVVSVVFGACASGLGSGPAAGPHVPQLTLTASSGEVTTLPRDLAAASFTVFVFFSQGCGCFEEHQARLRALQERFAARHVRFVIVDPEVGRTIEQDRSEAADRQLGAIFLDPGAKLAHALGAEFATFTTVVDGNGRIRYRGGIDSDKSHLRDNATAYLANALDDLTSGREPRVAQTKALGCNLQMW
jgi:hypothetical protein